MGKMLATAHLWKQTLLLFTLLGLSLSGCQIQGGADQTQKNSAKICSDSGSNSNLLLPWRSLSGFIRVMSSPFTVSPQPTTLAARINLRVPVAVAASPGTIYIADAGHNAIFRYERASDSISLLTTLPGMNFSTGLFVDDDLSLYVIDQLNAEVLQFDPAGSLIQRFSNSAELPQPVAVIVSGGRREIMVADAIRGHVLSFDPLGGVASVIGSRAGSSLQFDNIVAMARAPGGIYLVDKLQHRIHHLSPERYYTFGSEDLVSPGQIAVDNNNRVFVADHAGTELKVFQAGVPTAIVKYDESASTRFQQITGLWASDGFLYVADAQRASIDIFQIAPPCR